MITYDVATARLLLESAIARTQEPELTTEQVNQLMVIGSVDRAEVEWTVPGLNRAASIGWTWKAGLATGEEDELGGGTGISLKRSKMYDRCVAMANAYTPGGGSSVDGDPDNNPVASIDESFAIDLNFLTDDRYSEVPSW